MQTVSEAKYTYWHSIIDIATESGLSREEFCQKYKIAVKPFKHYERIFQRQKARGYVYEERGNQEVQTRIDHVIRKEGDRVNAEPAESVAGYKGTDPEEWMQEGSADAMKKIDELIEQSGADEKVRTDDRSRYVEIPMVEDHLDPVVIDDTNETENVVMDLTGMRDRVEEPGDPEDDFAGRNGWDHEADPADHQAVKSDGDSRKSDRDDIVLQVGGCRIVIGEDVSESRLISILKAVSTYA